MCVNLRDSQSLPGETEEPVALRYYWVDNISKSHPSYCRKSLGFYQFTLTFSSARGYKQKALLMF